MTQTGCFRLLFLTVVLLLVGALPGWAAVQTSGEVEVNVPPQGLTELDLENELCVYRGYNGAPVEVLMDGSELRLTALKITYDQRRQLLTAEEAVKLETAQMIATGETMILTQEQVRLPAGGEITTLEPEKVKLVVNGAFSYQFEDETFQGEGGTSLLGPEWVIEGQRFEGSLREEKVTVVDSPNIRWEEGFLQGEADTVITYDLNSGQAKVEGPTKTRFYQNRGVHPSGD